MSYRSWGNYPPAKQHIRRLNWLQEAPEALSETPYPLLPYGLGRSYGDSCLNDGGTLLDLSPLDRLLEFDDETGVLRAEAGMSLEQILNFAVPKGWFLPVTPGTKFVTLGGAVANDVHGKNHHQAGTFGRHVRAFELLRSDGTRLYCSPFDNVELFKATIGGLGLTGLITWAEVALRPITSALIDHENVKFANLDEFFEISAASDKHYEYTVAWVDCAAQGNNLGRGIFMRGNHADVSGELKVSPPSKLRAPIDAPNIALNRFTIGAFNTVYYGKQRSKSVKNRSHYEGFFYPLDAVGAWNRIYGKRGFLQYQFALPYAGDPGVTKEIFSRIAASKLGSFLAVLKMFGDLPSPGMLSFPTAGVTLALDFPNEGERTFQLLEALDAIIRDNGGRVYPAKDARMSAASFQQFFPNWQAFAQHIDPKFSSSFWRRVTPQASAAQEGASQ